MRGSAKFLVVFGTVLFMQSVYALEVTLTNDGREVHAQTYWSETPSQSGKDWDYHWGSQGVYQTSTTPKADTKGPNPTSYSFSGDGLSWYSYDCQYNNENCDGSQVTSRYDIRFSPDQDGVLDFSVSFDSQAQSMRSYWIKVEEWEGSYGTRIYPLDVDSGCCAPISGPITVAESVRLEAGKEYSFRFYANPYLLGQVGYEDYFISWALTGSITTVTNVDIDVLPGDAVNKVYPNKTGKLPVAILSSADFDAAQVDPATLRFGPAQASVAEPVSIEDADGINGNDTLARFKIEESGIFCNDAEASLSGETYAGAPFTGSDTIDATECESGGCHAY